MVPRHVEPAAALKQLGEAIQQSDKQLQEEQKKLNRDFVTKTEAILYLLEQDPENNLLKSRKEEIKKNFERSDAELLAKKKMKDKGIQNKISALVNDPDHKVQRDNFKKEFDNTLAMLDKELAKRKTLLNTSNVLEEFSKVNDKLVHGAVNKLAKKDILVNFNQVKAALIMRLCAFTGYDIEKTKNIADETTTLMVKLYQANEPISLEKLAKSLEQKLNVDPQKDPFLLVLNTLREPYTDYIRHKEYLYNNLYNAKKAEFKQALPKELRDTIDNQNQARHQFEEELLARLIKAKDPKDFYLTIIKLSMEEVDAKRKAIEENDTRCVGEFNRRKHEAFEQLVSELNNEISKFVHENMASSAIRKINVAEIQMRYMKAAMLGHATPDREKKEHHALTTTEAVLKAFEEENIPLEKTAVTANNAKKLLARVDLHKVDLYKDKINNNCSINAFKALLYFERNVVILDELKKAIESDVSKNAYLNIINNRLNQLADPHNISNKNMFVRPKVLSQPDDTHLSQRLVR